MGKGVILLSAGGTGGHLFPAEALAHELKRRGWSVHLATDARASRFAGSFPADGVHPVSSATLGSKNPLTLLKTFWTLWRGFREASVVLQRLKPEAVVGFGGYPTLPTLFAATRRGLPTLIHEQNAVMGRANKALSSRVGAIAGGFLEARASGFPEKTVATGNPARPAVIEAAGAPYDRPSPGGPFRLLVFGGSQGAQFFSEALPPALALLSPAQRARLVVTQQARPEDEAGLRAAYRELGVTAEISPFFADMAARMAKAHLVISRAGASTVTEIGIIGRPALLVPYPHALDHDQSANAAALAKSGGAEVHVQSSLDAKAIAALLGGLMDDPERLVTMAAAAKAAGKPDAAVLLADAVEAIAAGRPVTGAAREAHA